MAPTRLPRVRDFLFPFGLMREIAARGFMPYLQVRVIKNE